VVDMFGDARTADNPKDAGALSGSVGEHPDVMLARFNAARGVLAAQPTVDSHRIGAIGFCFGGFVVLNMARSGADLAGVAAFHPGLEANVPAAAPGKVRAKVLVLNGADDPFVSAESIAAFRKEMEVARVDYRFINYPGAVHSFTNPEATEKGKRFNLPLAYDAKADRQAKAEMTKFFAGVFGQ
jgi:dienelactone hydrolase